MVKRIVFFGILLFIIIAAVLLRFQGVNERGLFYFDEGLYLSETRFVLEGVDLILHNFKKLLSQGFSFEELKATTQGVPLVTGKPGFILVLYLFGLLTGLSEHTLYLASATFGIINIGLIYLIAQDFFDRKTALVSMAIASVSSYHLFYSSVGLPEMVGLTFYLAGFWLFYRSVKYCQRASFLIGSGLLIGYAFTCNQWRWILLPVFPCLFELIRFVKREVSPAVVFSRLSIFLVSFVTPIFIFQLPYQVLIWLKGPLPFRSYFEQLFERSMQGQSMLFSISGSATFLKYYWIIEGPFFTILLLTGISIAVFNALYKKNKEDILLCIVMVLPIIIFSVFKYGGYCLSRVISMVLPFTAIAIARLFGRIKNINLVYCFIVIILVLGVMHSYKISRVTSGYAKAAEYIKDKDYRKLFILENEPIFRAYLGRVAFNPYNRPLSLEELIHSSENSGVVRLVVDFNVLYSKYQQDYARELTNVLIPEAVFANPLGASFVHLTELYPYEIIKSILEDPRSKYIEIYNLDKFHKEFRR
ncbi:MAG: glycosyltransferase family 39 protein [Candidatus Omnitrophica bacterium]|nr:glycosyltransferase family 39 protein [Candidatus Omnitrophota bacterium]